MKAGYSCRSRFALFLACLMPLLLLTSCAGKKELEPVELKDVEEKVDIDHLWSKGIGDGLGEYFHTFSLAMDKHHIYAASVDGVIYKLDKEEGDVVWKVSLDDVVLTTGIAVDNRHAYVASDDGHVLALSQITGEQAWVADVGSEVAGPINAEPDHVLMQTSEGVIHDLDPATGKSRWTFATNMPSLTLRGTGKVVLFENYVVGGTANGKLVVLDASTGQLRWEPKLAEPKGDNEIERVIDVESTPVVIQGRMYAVSYHGQLVCFDLQTGRPLWSEEESSYRDLAHDESSLYVTSDNSVVTAYGMEDGVIRWANEDYLRRKLTAPALAGQLLAVGDFEGYIHLLDTKTSETIGRVHLNDSGIKAVILAEGRRFYAIANNGKLKAYEWQWEQ